MTKLHALLAVGSSLESQANKVRGELAATFDKKRHLFEEKRVVFTPNSEGAQQTVESQSDIQSTVVKELKWIQPFIAKAIDASYQIAEANTRGRANVVLEDGRTLLTGVPATSLLELEKRLAEIGELIKVIPTLDPAKGFKLDSSREPGIYQAREVRKSRSRKEKVVIVKYPHSEQHPAQTELVDKDVPIGTVEEQEWSGLMTPADKAKLIGKVEALSRAVRQARSRANDVEVDQTQKIGAAILEEIFG